MVNDRAGGDDLGRRIGVVIRITREETGWSQRELAARLRSSQSAIQRLEAGRSPYVDARLATAAFRILGIRAAFDARTLGLASRREQRDLVHARCLAYASRQLRRRGWDVRVEVEVGMGRYRGWIDLLAFREADRGLFVGEIKTEIHDAGAIQRAVGWYSREAPPAARRLGWRPAETTAALLLLCSADNDRAIRMNRGLLRATFPASARALADWLSSTDARIPQPSLAMVDPRTRRRDWLRPTASDGRHTPAPYATYADAADAIRAGARRPA
jgi:transcriptional regulator with XRE-family HTH domain